MTPREFSERLAKRARKANVTLDPQAVESLGAYYRLLEFWNEKVNLTAFSLKDAPDEAIDRLLIEPLVAARHLHGSHGRTCTAPHLGPHPRLLDIGSGGGSPAIPLKIAIPSLHLVMVESKTRKSAFLREAVRHLNLAERVGRNRRGPRTCSRVRSCTSRRTWSASGPCESSRSS